jgi:multisubunit Na+/H+ antiporter MnhF subunit
MDSSWNELLVLMIQNAPPADEPLPLANRKETLFGVTIPFLVVSWMAVIFRLWVRLRVVREPGWDDVFVLASALCNTAATVFVCLAVKYGLGHHMLYIGTENIKTYLMVR